MPANEEPKNDKTAAELFGKGSQPRNTRDKIIHEALHLFLEYGVHAVGIDRITAAVGVTKTTFYNHFPSRDELVVEVLKVRDEWEFETLMNSIHERAGYDPKKMLLAIFDVTDTWFRSEEFRGCLFLNTIAEFPSPTDPIHKAATQHQKRVREKVLQLAEAAGVADAERLATEWLLLVDGAVTHRLVSGDDQSALIARSMAEMLLSHHLPDEN